MDSPTRYEGVDWASRSHAVCIVDERGEPVERFEIEHSEPGLRTLGRRLAKAGATQVAIERPDGPVIDALFAAGLEVVVIASRHVKALRTRYGAAGNKDDRGDAFILADVLRTDGHRLRALQPDAPETVTLRATVRARKNLVHTRTRLTQQLRAHLELVYRAPLACSSTSTRRSRCGSCFGSRRRPRPRGSPRSGWRPGFVPGVTAAERAPTSCAGGWRRHRTG